VSSRTYVCFDCRTTERVLAARIARSCRKPAHHVYYKFKVSSRADDSGWTKLEGRVRPVNIEIQTHALARLRKRRAQLERILSSGTKKSELKQKQLRRQLRDVDAESREWLQWSAA